MLSNFEQLCEDSFRIQRLRPGDLLEVKVLEICKDKGYVLLDAEQPFMKSESLVPIEEFFLEESLEEIAAMPEEMLPAQEGGRKLEIDVGSTVLVALETIEDGYGHTILSREKAKRGLAWS